MKMSEEEIVDLLASHGIVKSSAEEAEAEEKMIIVRNCNKLHFSFFAVVHFLYASLDVSAHKWQVAKSRCG